MLGLKSGSLWSSQRAQGVVAAEFVWGQGKGKSRSSRSRSRFLGLWHLGLCWWLQGQEEQSLWGSMSLVEVSQGTLAMVQMLREWCGQDRVSFSA